MRFSKVRQTFKLRCDIPIPVGQRVVLLESEDSLHRVADDSARTQLSQTQDQLVLRRGAILVLVHVEAGI
jgi:hypothetical protein